MIQDQQHYFGACFRSLPFTCQFKKFQRSLEFRMNDRDCIFNYQALILYFHLSGAKKSPLVEISSSRSRRSLEGLRALPRQPASGIHLHESGFSEPAPSGQRAESRRAAVSPEVQSEPTWGCDNHSSFLKGLIYQGLSLGWESRGYHEVATSGESLFGKPMTHGHDPEVWLSNLTPEGELLCERHPLIPAEVPSATWPEQTWLPLCKLSQLLLHLTFPIPKKKREEKGLCFCLLVCLWPSTLEVINTVCCFFFPSFFMSGSIMVLKDL